MKKYSALIVDDEISAHNTLSGILREFCPYITPVEKAMNEAEALRLIDQFEPDIVFLDIEMPPFSNGIEMMSKLPERPFQIIITSAYPQYAIQSVNTIQPSGYLIKPFSVDQLTSVLRTTIKLLQQQTPEPKMQNEPGVIIADQKKGNIVIKYSEILYCKSEGSVVSIAYVENGKEQKVLTYKRLKDIEDSFPNNFIRIHHNTIVNMNKISRYIQIGRGGKAYLGGDNSFEISVSRMPYFQSRFDQYIQQGE